MNRLYVKRMFFCISVSSLLIYSIMGMPVSAVSNDSVNLSSEEEKLLHKLSPGTSIKLYNGMFMHGFAEKMTIDELLSKEFTLEEIYVNIPPLPMIPVSYLKIADGEAQHTDLIYDEGEFFAKYYDKGKSVLKSISVNAKIEKVYCLDGEPSHDGVYIYYVTNKGDFVLFKEYAAAENAYIMPLDIFYEFSSVVLVDRIKYGNYNGRISAIEELYDLSKFEVKETSGAVIGAAVAGSIMIPGSILCATVKKRKKKSSYNEE